MKRALALLVAAILALSGASAHAFGHTWRGYGRAWNPRDLGGSVLWLRADTGVTLTSSKVSGWVDISGSGNNATDSGVAGNRPTTSTTAGGLPAVAFAQSSNQYVNLPNAFQALTSAEVFLVAKVNTFTSHSNGLWDFGSNTSDANYAFSDSHIYDGFGSTARKDCGSVTGTPLDALRIYGVSTAASSYQARLDGTQFFTTATNTVGWSTTPKLGESHSVATGFDGIIAEEIIFSRVLTATERTRVQKYLGARYGITTP